MDWAAALLTAKLALATALILFVLGVPLAWWLSTSTSRFRFLVDAVVALPLVLPPTVLGFYLLSALAPLELAFTFPGLVVGSVLFNLPFAVRPFAAAFALVDKRLIEQSWCLGVSRLSTFVRVVLPLSTPGLVAGVVLTLAHAVGEFGVVLMIGGNIEGVSRTLSISLYDDVQALDYASAHKTALALIVFSFAALALTYRTQLRGPTRARGIV